MEFIMIPLVAGVGEHLLGLKLNAAHGMAFL